MNDINSLVIGSKSFAEWDQEWVTLKDGLKKPHPHLSHSTGLYRASIDGEVIAIGTGAGNRGGLAKPLSDLRRPRRSGDSRYSDAHINWDDDRLKVEVLITGRGPDAQKIAAKLVGPTIQLLGPSWTLPNAS